MFTTIISLILLSQVTADRYLPDMTAPSFTVTVFQSIKGSASDGSEFLVCIQNDSDGAVMVLNRCWVRDPSQQQQILSKDSPPIAGLTHEEAVALKAMHSRGLSVEIELDSDAQIRLPTYSGGGKLEFLEVGPRQRTYRSFFLPGSVVTDRSIRCSVLIKRGDKVFSKTPFKFLPQHG